MGEIETDFISNGSITVQREHIYLNLVNAFTGKYYVLHLPKSLFCIMLKNRVIIEDKFEWVTKEDKEQLKKEITKDKLKGIGMFG